MELNTVLLVLWYSLIFLINTWSIINFNFVFNNINFINNCIILFISRIMYLLNIERIVINPFFFYFCTSSRLYVIIFNFSFSIANRERIINTLFNLFFDIFTDITVFRLLMNKEWIINTLFLIYFSLDVFYFDRFTTINKSISMNRNICILTLLSF